MKSFPIYTSSWNHKRCWYSRVGIEQCPSSMHLVVAINICRSRQRKAFILWKIFVKFCFIPEITPTFEKLRNIAVADLVTDDDFAQVENFFFILYSPIFSTNNVNTARRIFFTQGSRSLETIPPTFNWFQKHILRSCHQETKWSNALLKQPLILLDPLNWDREKLGEILYFCGRTSPTHRKHFLS